MTTDQIPTPGPARDRGVGIFRDAFTQPFRWEIRDPAPDSGFVLAAGEAESEAAARAAMADALVRQHKGRGDLYAMEADGVRARALESLPWAQGRVPLDVALSLVTGRRLDRREHEALTVALCGYFLEGARAVERRDDSPALMAALRRFAARVFPIIARETGDELDAERDPYCVGPWLAEREARYGPTVALRLEAR